MIDHKVEVRVHEQLDASQLNLKVFVAIWMHLNLDKDLRWHHKDLITYALLDFIKVVYSVNLAFVTK